MMVMKCQRLTADKTSEEIEIEVPVSIFNRMVVKNGDQRTENLGEKKTFSNKLKNIFVR